MTRRGPDHYVLADVQVAGKVLRGIRCKVYLEPADAHRSRVILFPDPAIAQQIFDLDTVPLVGYFPSPAGQNVGYLRVPKFFVTSAPTFHWGPGLSEARVHGLSSAIITRKTLGTSLSRKGRVVLWLHGGSVLRPSAIHTRSFTGASHLQRKWRCRARLGPRTLIVFDEYTAFPKRGPEHEIRQLVLCTDLPAPLSGPAIMLRRHERALETVLTLASIAGRERVTWHRAEASDGRSFLEYWETMRRPGVARQRGEAPLIERYTIPRFLKQTFDRLEASPQRDLLLDASYALAPYYRLPIESAFLTNFSRLEALVMSLSASPTGVHLLPQQRWPSLRKALQKLIKSWRDQRGELNVDERKAMYLKLAELNRPPFGHLWHGYITAQGIPMSDLWPVQTSDGSLDLLMIRNKLAHGAPMPQLAVRPLSHALHHLRWALERIVLQALGYPLAGTAASPQALAGRNLVTEERLSRERQTITAAWP